VLLAAQAALYRYFLHDRALYDRFTAIASSQAMGIEELLMVIGTLEARALGLYRQNAGRVRIPQPAYSGRREKITL
jgi:hypothetical protein